MITLGVANPLFLGGLVGIEAVAANVLAIKNGTAAQALRVYGTTTGPQYVELGHSGNAYIDVQGGAALSIRMNGVSQWFFSAAGHLLADADNTEDVGAAGATRPRSIYVGTSLNIGTNPASAGALRLANNAEIRFRNAANSGDVLGLTVAGDNKLTIGDSAICAGIQLYTLSGTVLVGSALSLQTVTPATFGVNQNNFSIGTGSTGGVIQRLAATAGALSITGFGSPLDGRVLIICNVGANAFSLANQSASSTDVNRIITGTGAALSVGVDQSVTLVYDSTTQRWRVLKNA